jgi:Uma2 family endonuclease
VKHADLSLKIACELMIHIEKRKGRCKVFHAPFDVCLPKNGETADNKIYTVVQPDICVICDLSKLDERCCLGAPDLVVEIQSPSTARYDLTKKFRIYEESGVREYWVVFPKKVSITVFHLQADGKFDEGTVFKKNDKVTSHVLEGLEIDMKGLFTF